MIKAEDFEVEDTEFQIITISTEKLSIIRDSTFL